MTKEQFDRASYVVKGIGTKPAMDTGLELFELADEDAFEPLRDALLDAAIETIEVEGDVKRESEMRKRLFELIKRYR